MKTEIIKDFELGTAIQSLKNGDPVVFPTETVYGLGAPIFNEEAIQKIFLIKNRPRDNPLIAHISKMKEAYYLAEELGEIFELLAKAFWPGPLTLIAKKRMIVSDLVSAGHPTIAIRMPKHKLARKLIKGVGEPLVAPSANLSGRPSPTSASDAIEDLDGKVRYIIDGGSCQLGLESTVLSLMNETPLLLRPGMITQEEIEKVLKMPIEVASKNSPNISPGMKHRHYAPKAELKLVFQKEELEAPYLIPNAKTFYADLREFDRNGARVINVYVDEKVKSDLALMNRLLHAAGQIV